MPRPRPKKARPGATRSEPQSKPAEDPQSSASPLPVNKSIPEQSTLPPDAPSDIYDVSDREKELRKQRIAKRKSQTEADLHLNSEQSKALDYARKRRDDAMDRLDNLTSTSAAQAEESPDIELSRNDSATMADVQRPPRLTDVSGLDLDDDVFGNLDDSLDDTEHAIEDTRDGHTRSTDTSTFNIASFKRRPRQSSVAGRDDAPIRPSSRGQMTPSISSTLNFGRFKRRAREPSILGTARKDRPYRSASRGSQASRNREVLKDRDDDDEDSGPDGESTPIDTRRRSRRSRDAETPALDSPTQPSRKRKSLEAHEDGREKRTAVEVESPEAAEGAAQDEVMPSIEDENQPPVSSPLSSPPIKGWLEQDRLSTPDRDDPDMAPPVSDSASEGESPIAWPPIHTLAQRRYVARPPPPRAHKTPELDDDIDSNISSPPSLTHSPNYKQSRNAKPAPKKKAPVAPPKPTTDDLASLLPQRRSKRVAQKKVSADPFDIDGSSEEEGETELPVLPKPRSNKKPQKQALGSKSASANRKGKGKADAPRSGKKSTVKTYGSRVSDKENEGEEEVVDGSGEENEDHDGDEAMADVDTSQLHLEEFGEELHNAAKKFKEVDKYELTYETVEARSSSLGPDAR
ncbi:hypothetical protein QBC38DRAFT_225831 [Podospora fimiseda]|uniref:Uncharacterized protein n=1 Tax=Podospora fimiseda TaxID=252190 RepID=A0AAN7H827_9PEZI|nr:hypothetical protein QBC38DRAFT_225831 [Podospora fimiseda]